MNTNMIYIITEKLTVYIFAERVKSISDYRKEHKAKVCYVDGQDITYIDVKEIKFNLD